MRKKISSIVILFTLSLIICYSWNKVLAANSAKAQNILTFEELMPASTILFLQGFELTEFNRRVQNTALGKVLQHPEITEFIELLSIRKEELIDKLITKQKIKRTSVETILSSQFGLAFHGINPLTGKLLVYLSVSFKEIPQRKEIYNVLKALAWQNLSQKIPAQEIMINNTPVLNLPMPGFKHSLFKENNYFCLLDNILIMSTNKASMQQLIKTYKDPKKKHSLANSSRFRIARIGSNSQPRAPFIYLNSGIAIPLMQLLTSAENVKLISALGLPSVEAIGISMTFTERGISNTLYLHCPKQRSGILQILSLSHGAERAARLIPEQAGTIFSARVNLVTLYHEIPQLVDAISKAQGKPGVSDLLLSTLTGKQEIFGVPVEEILQTMGDWIIMQKGPAGTALRFENANPKAFEKLISRMEEKQESSFTTITEGKYILRYFNQSGHPVPLAPTYTLLPPNRIMIASHPQVIKAILRQKANASLASQLDFIQVAKALPTNTGLLYYVNCRDSYARVYDAALPFLNVITAYPGVAADPGVLPPGNELTKNMFGFGISIKNSRQGLTITAYSPLGVGGPLIYLLDQMVVNNPATMGMAVAAVYHFFGWDTNADKTGSTVLQKNSDNNAENR